MSTREEIPAGRIQAMRKEHSEAQRGLSHWKKQSELPALNLSPRENRQVTVRGVDVPLLQPHGNHPLSGLLIGEAQLCQELQRGTRQARGLGDAHPHWHREGSTGELLQKGALHISTANGCDTHLPRSCQREQGAAFIPLREQRGGWSQHQ